MSLDTSLRPDDRGNLWEHMVLGELIGQLQQWQPLYWRDKRGHEIDFVVADKGGNKPITIECKWSASKFDPANLHAFRRRYPEGNNYVVASDVTETYQRDYGGVRVHFISLQDLGRTIS
ncbi:MAG: DUF4143 domain-containing protein [Parachlamydiales bacterium]